MARISTVEAKARISEMINRVAYGGERLVIQRRGKDLVALVPLEDYLVISGEAEQRVAPSTQPYGQEESDSLIDPPVQQIDVQVELEEDDDRLEVNLL